MVIRANFWHKNSVLLTINRARTRSFSPGKLQLIVACWLSLHKIFANCMLGYCNVLRVCMIVLHFKL